MAHLAYLTLKGEKQGLISSGCNTKDSMGNRYQETHTDQITVLACQYSLSKLPHQHGINHDGIQITKPKDKASPLLATAFARQEHLEGTIDFYRTNEQGHYQKFYSVAFQKAVISGVSDVTPHVIHSPGEEMHEMITFSYKGVQWEHFPCGTLAYDGWSDANTIAAMAPPLTSAERYAKQIQENMQAEKAAEQQEEKEKQSKQQRKQSDAKEEEDWKPVPGSYPILVYETINKMGDTSADDLKHGDLERKDIIRMGQLYNFAINPDELAYPASWHFNVLKSGTWLLSWGKYSPIIKEMIERFESNTGDKYESNLLNEAMKEHSTTQKFVSDIKKFTSDYIFSHDKQIGSDFTTESKNYLNKNSVLPKFNDFDWFNGLGIAVHDVYAVYAVRVYAQKLEYKDKQIRGKLSFEIQDHFGLDKKDLNGKEFEYMNIFRSWFLLQRYSKYDYKPFITEMNFPVEF